MDSDDQRPSSALARGIHVTELHNAHINPEPVTIEEADVFLDGYLSPTRLRLIAGVDNLDEVKHLEFSVDTTCTSLGNFGSMLPNLQELKFINSIIPAVRDLGASVRELQVLWMSRVGLQELDGISSMTNLKELYLSYNEVNDLSPLSMLDQLEILDLEGNNVDDMTQVEHLSLCGQLRSLMLEGNPVCLRQSPDICSRVHLQLVLNYDYRETVSELLPELQYLDDEPTSSGSNNKKPNIFEDDWAFLEELSKDEELHSAFQEDIVSTSNATNDSSTSRPLSAMGTSGLEQICSRLGSASGLRPESRSGQRTARPMTSRRPNTAGLRPGTAAAQASLSKDMDEEVSSSLTMGTVICGNPAKALRARRQNNSPKAENKAISQLKSMSLCLDFDEGDSPIVLPDGPADLPSDLSLELEAWRKRHTESVMQIKNERAAQVLTIDYDDASLCEDSDGSVEDEDEAYNPNSLADGEIWESQQWRLGRPYAEASEEGLQFNEYGAPKIDNSNLDQRRSFHSRKLSSLGLFNSAECSGKDTHEKLVSEVTHMDKPDDLENFSDDNDDDNSNERAMKVSCDASVFTSQGYSKSYKSDKKKSHRQRSASGSHRTHTDKDRQSSTTHRDTQSPRNDSIEAPHDSSIRIKREHELQISSQSSCLDSVYSRQDSQDNQSRNSSSDRTIGGTHGIQDKRDRQNSRSSSSIDSGSGSANGSSVRQSKHQIAEYQEFISARCSDGPQSEEQRDAIIYHNKRDFCPAKTDQKFNHDTQPEAVIREDTSSDASRHGSATSDSGLDSSTTSPINFTTGFLRNNAPTAPQGKPSVQNIQRMRRQLPQVPSLPSKPNLARYS